MRGLVSFTVGFIFAIGLSISGMTQVQVVKGFLDIFGEWNTALIGVMVGAIAVHSIVYFFIKSKDSPLLDTHFHLPTRKDIDKRLLIGAIIFGFGWGWGGICPGPGLVGLTGLNPNFTYFIFSMFAGMYLFKLLDKKIGNN